ncbi:MAG: putative Zn-dependent protease, involved in pqq synthesis (ppqF) [Nitrospirae bacterium]|nr:putative Zn-dependent protease, involved in pqq synthesis (ppqF) [Nitrospirota bacterium]
MQKIRETFMVVLLLLFLSTLGFGQEMRVTETILPNGLKVLLKEEHKSPVVTFQVWYRVGARNERLGKTGMSHLLEHMMFKGSKKYGPKQFSQVVQRNGGNDNAFTSKDYTAYFENLAADRLEIAMDLESDRMQNLLLDPKEFLSERDVVKEERRMRYEDDPTQTMVEQMMATAFSAHPYQWPVIGWMADIGNITREDLEKHYRTYYAPNNATVVVVGDFDSKKTLALVEKYFGSIPRGPEVPKVGAVEPKQLGEKRVKVKQEAELPAIYAGYKVPNLTSADSHALNVLQGILSSGKSSRLYRSLVYDKQIALYAGGDYDDVSTDPNLFYVYAGIMPGKSEDEVERALYVEIDRMKNEPVSDEELQKAKNQAEAGFIMSQDSMFYQAMLLGQYETVANWKLLGAYLDGIRAVKKEDIERVARQYFTEDNRTVGILVPVKKP